MFVLGIAKKPYSHVAMAWPTDQRDGWLPSFATADVLGLSPATTSHRMMLLLFQAWPRHSDESVGLGSLLHLDSIRFLMNQASGALQILHLIFIFCEGKSEI